MAIASLITIQEIKQTLSDTFNIADAAWFASLEKTAHSKNITTADWNAVVLKVSANMGSIESLHQALLDAMHNLDTRATNVYTKVMQHADELDTHGTAISKNLSDISKAQSDIRALNTRTSNMRTELQNAQQDLDVAESDIDTLQNDVIVHSSNISDNSTAIAEAQKMLPSRLTLELDPSTYILKAKLHCKGGTVLASSDIDLPLEHVVMDVTYDDITDALVVTLNNGNNVRIPIHDILEDFTNDLKKTFLKDYVTDVELANEVTAAVDKIGVLIADNRSIVVKNAKAQVNGIFPVNSSDFTAISGTAEPVRLFLGTKEAYDNLAPIDKYNTLGIFTDDGVLTDLNTALAELNKLLTGESVAYYSKQLEPTLYVNNTYDNGYVLVGYSPTLYLFQIPYDGIYECTFALNCSPPNGQVPVDTDFKVAVSMPTRSGITVESWMRRSSKGGVTYWYVVKDASGNIMPNTRILYKRIM